MPALATTMSSVPLPKSVAMVLSTAAISSLFWTDALKAFTVAPVSAESLLAMASASVVLL